MCSLQKFPAVQIHYLYMLCIRTAAVNPATNCSAAAVNSVPAPPQGPRTKFLDTLSLHTCVAGQTTTQKILWKNRGGWDAVRKLAEEPGRKDNWMSVSSPNSLQEVHWLYVGSEMGGDHEGINKQKRDVFVKGTIKAIRKQFQVHEWLGYSLVPQTMHGLGMRQVQVLFMWREPGNEVWE